MKLSQHRTDLVGITSDQPVISDRSPPSSLTVHSASSGLGFHLLPTGFADTPVPLGPSRLL
jgi:hypothetical protein